MGFTYDSLVSAVAALAEDDSVEFTSYIPTAILLTEERLIKEIDVLGVQAVTSITATVSNPVLQKPSGYLLGHDLSYNTSTGRVFVTKRSIEFLQDYWPTQTSVGRPKYYADESNTTFLVAPAPVSAYEFKLRYTSQVSSLSVSVQTNYYTDNCSDALFYGIMSNMSEFMKDYSTQQVWESKYNAAVTLLNNQGRRERRDSSMITNNPLVQKNTLKGDN